MCAQHKKMKTSWQLSRILQRKCVVYSSQSHHHRSFIFFKVRRFLQKHGTIRTLQYYKRKRVTSKRYSKSWLASYGYVERQQQCISFVPNHGIHIYFVATKGICVLPTPHSLDLIQNLQRSDSRSGEIISLRINIQGQLDLQKTCQLARYTQRCKSVYRFKDVNFLPKPIIVTCLVTASNRLTSSLSG